MIKSVIGAALAAAVSSAALAQPLAPPPPCDGRYATLRLSAVNAGKWAEFEKAVHDQAAWYAARRLTAYPKMVRILHADPSVAGYADDEAVTITVHPDITETIQPDADWNAFVAEFRDSSTIKEERQVCLPDLMRP
ncbi:MAG: hypothetical protein WDM92_02575 [Caulobacteraceae bacterium]